VQGNDLISVDCCRCRFATLQDAIDLSQGFMKAMRAANIGASDLAAAAALNPNTTTAANSSDAAPVTAQDGPTNTAAPTTVAEMVADAMNVMRVGGLLASLPNMTDPITVIARVRDAVANGTGAAQQPERRTTVSVNTARDPTLPSWLNTGSPDAAPEVYSRYVADRGPRPPGGTYKPSGYVAYVRRCDQRSHFGVSRYLCC
jgi:hypothetical protein